MENSTKRNRKGGKLDSLGTLSVSPLCQSPSSASSDTATVTATATDEHKQHEAVMDHVTTDLKDKVRLGLDLLDGCFNTLTEAKSIFLNIDRALEKFNEKCPVAGCDSTLTVPVTSACIPVEIARAIRIRSAEARANLGFSSLDLSELSDVLGGTSNIISSRNRSSGMSAHVSGMTDAQSATSNVTVKASANRRKVFTKKMSTKKGTKSQRKVLSS